MASPVKDKILASYKAKNNLKSLLWVVGGWVVRSDFCVSLRLKLKNNRTAILVGITRTLFWIIIIFDRITTNLVIITIALDDDNVCLNN